jgi:LmbE family N-acetylglucosaminyl deacetylase
MPSGRHIDALPWSFLHIGADAGLARWQRDRSMPGGNAAVLQLPARLRRFLRPMVRASKVLEAMRDLPVTDSRTLLGEAPVLVLAPHPDDESLGCGGLIAGHNARGHDAHVMILTDGAASHPHSLEYPAARLAALRMREARAAIVALGLPVDRIDFLGLPDGRAPLSGKRLADAAACVAAHALSRRVRTICTTLPHDPHHDHRAAYRLGQLVARAIGARLLLYPVWTWTVPPTGWLPDTPVVQGARLDITRHLEAKRRAIACHRSQITDLIRDDPCGFRMSPEFLAIFDWPFEVFVDG